MSIDMVIENSELMLLHRRVGRLGVVPHTEGRHRWYQPEAVPSRLGRRRTVHYAVVHRR